jgi:hypothetical protein
MRFLIYNIRGFGAPGRRSQLRDYTKQHRVDIIGLQETIKQEFSSLELRRLECGGQFSWNWLPASGHSGRMDTWWILRVGPKRKYHMVDWDTVCKPREFRGLGVLNTKVMNIALLLKWIWKIYRDGDGLWADLLRAKYLGDNDLFSPVVDDPQV